MRDVILVPYSCTTFYQMNSMFYGAKAFNQPLSTFNTAAVKDVSAFLCGVGLEKPDSDDSQLQPNLLSDVMDVLLGLALQSTTAV